MTRPPNRMFLFDASHPLVCWMHREVLEIVGATDLPEALKIQVRLHAIRGIDQLARADEKKTAFLEKSERLAARFADGVYDPGEHGAFVESAGMSDDYQLFLVRLVIAIRMAIKVAAIALIGEPKGWKFVRQGIERRFNSDHPLHKVITSHRAWTDDLLDARGEVEHDPFIFDGFFVIRNAEGGLEVDPPRTPSGAPIPEVVPRYWLRGVEFFEELVVRSLETKLPPGRSLVEIPEGSRDPQEPIRYRIA